MWIIANTGNNGPAPHGVICYRQHLYLQKPLHIVVEDKGTGCCQRYRQHLPGGPSSTSSSTSVVATVGDIDSTSQGAHHRCLLQLRWWLLPEIPTAPLRGPAIDVFFNFGGGCCRRYQQHLPGAPPSTSSSTSMVATAGGTDSTSQGPRHRCLLQFRWWLLPEIPATPPRGPTIDVFFNFSGGYCWRYRQHLPVTPPSTSSSISVVAAVGDIDSNSQGAHHRCLLQLRWWLLLEILAAPPRGQPSTFG
jgi:hypothetical protein